MQRRDITCCHYKGSQQYTANATLMPADNFWSFGYVWWVVQPWFPSTVVPMGLTASTWHRSPSGRAGFGVADTSMARTRRVQTQAQPNCLPWWAWERDPALAYEAQDLCPASGLHVCLVAVVLRKTLAFWGLMMQKGWPALMKDYNCALLREGKLEVGWAFQCLW